MILHCFNIGNFALIHKPFFYVVVYTLAQMYQNRPLHPKFEAVIGLMVWSNLEIHNNLDCFGLQ